MPVSSGCSGQKHIDMEIGTGTSYVRRLWAGYCCRLWGVPIDLS